MNFAAEPIRTADTTEGVRPSSVAELMMEVNDCIDDCISRVIAFNRNTFGVAQDDVKEAPINSMYDALISINEKSNYLRKKLAEINDRFGG